MNAKCYKSERAEGERLNSSDFQFKYIKAQHAKKINTVQIT